MLTSNLLQINIIGIIFILYKYQSYNNLNYKINYIYYKKISLWISIISISIGLIYLLKYNLNIINIQFIENIFNLYFGVDGISLLFIELNLILIFIAILANWKNIQDLGSYSILILLLGILLNLNFLCLDIISFYIFFESTLAPLYIIISLFGALNKEKAAKYILIYTLASSLWMLLSISFYTTILGKIYYKIIEGSILNIEIQSLLFIGIFIGIAVKTPLLPFHTWLPVVHSESPLGGSIILAGIILKIAIYAIIRLILPGLSESIYLFNSILYTIGILSIIYTSLITLRQIDLKVIIAYSSISHLGVCILGILSNNIIGIEGSIILSLAHGFVSPALFLLVGGIFYDRFHNRLIYYYQGLGTYYPLFCIYLLLFSLCNIGTPLSANFIGELTSLIGSFNKSILLGSLACISILLSACYQMKLTNKLTGGIYSKYLTITNDINNREQFLLKVLFIPVLIFGILPNLLTIYLHESCSTLLYII